MGRMDMNLRIELTDSSESMTSGRDAGMTDIATELLKAAESNTLTMGLVFEADTVNHAGAIRILFHPSTHPNASDDYSSLGYALFEPEFENLHELKAIKAWAEAAIAIYESQLG